MNTHPRRFLTLDPVVRMTDWLKLYDGPDTVSAIADPDGSFAQLTLSDLVALCDEVKSLRADVYTQDVELRELKAAKR